MNTNANIFVCKVENIRKCADEIAKISAFKSTITNVYSFILSREHHVFRFKLIKSSRSSFQKELSSVMNSQKINFEAYN